MTKAKQGNNGFSATVQNLTEDQTSHIQPDHICSPGHGGNMQNSNGDSPTKCGQAIFNRMGLVGPHSHWWHGNVFRQCQGKEEAADLKKVRIREGRDPDSLYQYETTPDLNGCHTTKATQLKSTKTKDHTFSTQPL